MNDIHEDKKIIGICGGPVVGKTAILDIIASLNNVELYSIKKDGEHIFYTEIVIGEKKIGLMTTQGHLFFENKAWINIFSASDVIVYVFSANKRSIPNQELHTRQFNKHVKIATLTNKLWTNIPWLIVHNTSGNGVIPLGVKLPYDLSENVFSIDQNNKHQISLLWDNIKKIL
jgi:hypothetical protein